MEEFLVSVIIPTYNREKLVIKAISSVLKQTHKNIELIIIDDCSGDNTFGIVSEFCKNIPQAVILRNKINLGFVKTLNKAVNIARGKYIARLDDDDIWIDPQKIEKQVEFLEKNKEYVLVGGGVVKTDESGKEIVKYILPKEDKDIRKTILASNVFIHSSVVFPKKIWEKIKGYKEEFGFFADWELWLNMGKFGKFYNFPDFFVNYLEDDQISLGNSHDIQIRRKLKESIKMKKNYRDYYSGYKKAIIFSFVSYFYSFLPFRDKLSDLVYKTKKLFFGLSSIK